MQFAHALHDGLTALKISFHTERGIFGRQARKTLRHFLLVVLGLRLDCDFDHWIREGHCFQDYRLFHIAQRIARSRVLQTGKRDDIPRKCLFDLFAIIRVHHHHAANALFFTLGRVKDTVTLIHHA